MPASSGLAPRDETFQRAALELHERRGEVLHRPGTAALLGHAAQPVDFPRKHVHQVEEVGEVVQQRPLVLGPPPRRGLAAVHVAVDVVQVPDRALVQQLLHPDPVAFPAAVVIDLQQDAGTLAGIDHGVALLQRKRHGLLADDALRGRRRGASHDHLPVQFRVRRDDAYVRADLVQHLPVVVVEGVDPVAFAEQVQLLAATVDSGHQGERVANRYGVGVVVGMLRSEIELRPYPARSYNRDRVAGHADPPIDAPSARGVLYHFVLTTPPIQTVGAGLKPALPVRRGCKPNYAYMALSGQFRY